MNMLITNENLNLSAMYLDDKRLIKQILECYQILKVNERVLNGETKVGHSHHPIIVYYRDYPRYVALFGLACCEEYNYRYHKIHKYMKEFIDIINSDKYIDTIPEYPMYVSGSTKVMAPISYELNRNKMITKWDADKLAGKSPKWTNRPIPNFYFEHLIINSIKLEEVIKYDR